MRKLCLFLLLFIAINANAQIYNKPLKLIPEMSLKIGSQQPAIGSQLGIISGFMFTNQIFAGIGFSYATNMGMGGATYPLYIDGRYYFHIKNAFLFKSKDQQNDFQIDLQMGMNINPNQVFKTGFIAGVGFAYKFDFVKIKEFKIPDFYIGLNIEYNHSNYFDEYRGFVLKDGYLTHTLLNIKLAFDIKAFRIVKP